MQSSSTLLDQIGLGQEALSCAQRIRQKNKNGYLILCALSDKGILRSRRFKVSRRNLLN